MRTIKFRAWDKLLNKIIPIEWDYYTGDAFATPERLEIMQFTGLIDKNGKEVYEADIIEMDDREYGEGRPNNLRVVDFEDGSFTTNTWSKSDIQEWCEVIGNIYSNPELLNKN